MCKTVSKLLPLFLLALLWGLPLHADELSEEQIKEISALWDEAQRLVGEEDYQAALKITEQVLDKLDQWRADEFSLYAWQELEVKILMRDQQYPAASKKQKELLSLTKDLFGDKAPKTLKARAFLSDLDKIAALTPEQQKELSEGEAAYHAAWSKGDLEKTIELGEQMAAKEKKYLGEDCSGYANSLLLLAEDYAAAEKYRQAEAKYLEGLRISEKLYGQMHLNTAIWCDFLATLHSDLGEEEKAQPFLVRMYAIRHPVYGDQLKALEKQVMKLMPIEDQVDRFINVNSQYIQLYQFIFGKNEEPLRVNFGLQAYGFVMKAVAQKESGDREGLLNSLARAVQFVNLSRDEKKPDASIIGLIGSLYREQGEDSKAESLLKQALAIREKALGPDHPDVAFSLSSLASFFQEQGKYDEAEPLFQRSLAIYEKALGLEHPDVVLSLNGLASLYGNKGKYTAAEPLIKRALTIREKALGPDHPDVAASLNSLSIIYTKQGKYAEAEPLIKRALTICEKALGPNHPDVATSLNNLATLYHDKGEYAVAEPLFKRYLAIEEKALGPEHPDVALGLNNLAALYSAQGKYAEAESLYQRSLEIREKSLGPNHRSVADGLGNLSSLYIRLGKYAEAETLLKRSLAIEEKALGPEHPDVALGLNNLAALYSDQGKYAEAEPLIKRALAIREKALGPDHPDVALSLNNLAALYSDQGKYAEAEPLYERALAIWEKAFGPDHPDVALGLGNLGELYHDQGKYAEAEPLLKQALAIKEKALGPDHPDVALGLGNLGELYNDQGKYAEAEPLTKRALAIREKALGPDHPDVALSLHNLGLLYNDQGKYAEAEPLYERALEIWEKAFGPDHPEAAFGLGNLGLLYSHQGKYAEAEQLTKRALAIREKAFGPDHPDVATSLNNLASLYSTQGKYAEAESLLKQALSIEEKVFGPDNPGTATSLSNLAIIYSNQGKYAEAEPLYDRALAICEKALGPDHPSVAIGLNNLAVFYSHQGKYAEAEPLLKQALAIKEKALGPDHPDVALSLSNLGALYSDQDKHAEALVYLERGLKLKSRHLAANANVQSERQQLTAADNLKIEIGSYINSCLQLKENYGNAYQMALASKGAVTRRQQLMRSFADSPELGPLFANLQSTASQLSTAYSSKKQIDPKLRAERIVKLTKQKEAIEQQISRQSQSFRQALREVTTRDLQVSLPQNSVLIDFCQYATVGRDKSEQKTIYKVKWCLAAFIIRPEGPIELVDLCSREELQLALFFWKENLGRNTEPAIELGKLIWEPLAQYVDDAELVLYSPIAELGSLPFAALPGKEPGSYLIEEKQLVMIPQAKLLPSLLEREQSPKPTVLAIGGVDYESVAENETEEPVQLAASRRAVRWKDEAIFTPLPETETELDAIGKLYNQQFDLGKLQTLKDDRATEAAVKRLAPQYSHLHFATHGFFAPPEVKSALDNSDNQFARQLSFDDQPRFTGFHPGLLSGLALAGANDPPEEGEDGIWTAEEVATMNLSNVDLAVLSACETGLGKVAGGEGLLGLQRAFQVSGAGTTVASLWQVDDAATRALMDEFYRNLWEKKLPKIEALRQAQLKMLREYDPQKGTLRGVGGVRQLDTDGKPERLPPSYWAAWVLSGDWR